jgi:hypothetical protein
VETPLGSDGHEAVFETTEAKTSPASDGGETVFEATEAKTQLWAGEEMVGERLEITVPPWVWSICRFGRPKRRAIRP